MSIAKAEAEEFKQGVIDLFLERRRGHLGKYCFSSPLGAADRVRGNEHWAKFIEANSCYYPNSDVVAIIRDSAKQIGAAVADAGMFVDMGSGSAVSFEHKVMPILQAGKFSAITFVDMASGFSDVAQTFLLQRNMKLALHTHLANFFKELPVLTENAALCLFGITLGNIIVDVTQETPRAALGRTMKHFASALHAKGGYFIFDYDTNEDGQAIRQTYEDPHYHAMEMTIFERVKRDLKTEHFDPAEFEHVTVWHGEQKLLAQELRAKKALDFVLEGRAVHVPQGKGFHTGNSFKYSDADIEQAAAGAGFMLAGLFRKPGSTMRVAVYAI